MSEIVSNKITWIAASLALASALIGCQPETDTQPANSSESELATQNGLAMLNGLSLTNGLSGNGLSGNGLSGNGLSGNGLLMDALTSTTAFSSTSTLMSSTSGRSLVSYIVKCALPANHNVTKKDSGGTSYTFAGLIGTAPEWETGTCGTTCQERMSACLLAHVNTSGVHIPIWLDSEGAIGWGTSTDYPYQEGSFFGNVFVSPPVAQYCNGKDFDSAAVPGRLGANANAPYTNPFGGNSLCSAHCTAHSTDGFTQCGNYTHVVTVWRNFDVNTQYKICNKGNSLCLSVSGSSKSTSAAIIQSTYTAASNQKWTITQISPKKYKIINVNSGLALDITGAKTTDGTAAIQYTYSGAANQLWSFSSLADQLGSYVLAPTSNSAGSLFPGNTNNMSSGTAIVEWTYNTSDMQKWFITPG